jgi:hypothetical protein
VAIGFHTNQSLMVPQRREQAYQTLMEGALSKQAVGATLARRPSPNQSPNKSYNQLLGPIA